MKSQLFKTQWKLKKRKKEKEWYLDTTLEFFDLDAAKEKDEKKIRCSWKRSRLKTRQYKSCGKKTNLFEDLSIGEDDIFDIDNLKDEDKKYILDLINKTDFSQEGNIYFKKDNDEEMKPAIIKDERQKDLKIEDLLLPKPKIFQKKLKKNFFSTRNTKKKL